MRLFASLVASVSLCYGSGAQTVRLQDHSDWWSKNSEKYPSLIAKPLEKGFDTNNFRVLGLSLDTVDFGKVAAVLGKAKTVQRGDASFSREQACYVSVGTAEKVYVIFEFGEGMESTFYLFSGGAEWNGSNLCVKSSHISERLITGSGLKLGLSRAEVETILGKPDVVADGRIAYCREFQRKATAEEFERQRREYPSQLSDKLAHQKFDFVPVTLEVEARFKYNQMNYLYVSTISRSDN